MDGFWHVDQQDLSSGMGRRQRVAGNTVGLRTKIRISGIGEPALLARMGINPLLDVWQLLRPIHTGIAQVFVCVCRSAPGFVAIRHLCREYRHGGDEAWKATKPPPIPKPAAAMLRERNQTRCSQQGWPVDTGTEHDECRCSYRSGSLHQDRSLRAHQSACK